ncbi:MAG: hypothetical protein K2M00_10115 [Muribaculaceae bacterium]|nr:hypothetical protein [Muribaculaceae bacterium]
MNNFFLPVLFLSLPAAAGAMDFAADTVLNPAPVEMQYHLRVLPGSRGKSTASLCWNILESGDCQFARLTYDPAGGGAEWEETILLELGSKVNGTETVGRHNLRLDGDPLRLGYSLRLGLTAGGATVAAAVRRAEEWFPVAFDVSDSLRFEVRSTGIKKVLRYDLQSLSPEPPRYASFDNCESLHAYLATSTDACEGLWTHYDSDTDPRLTAIGGQYTVATVSRGDGNYDIVYLDGDPSWKELRIKGTLSPATFPGIFDLVWLQPSGVPVGTGCGAQILDDLLTLSFPYWKATLRLRRLKIDN